MWPQLSSLFPIPRPIFPQTSSFSCSHTELLEYAMFSHPLSCVSLCPRHPYSTLPSLHSINTYSCLKIRLTWQASSTGDHPSIASKGLEGNLPGMENSSAKSCWNAMTFSLPHLCPSLGEERGEGSQCLSMKTSVHVTRTLRK